MTDSRLRGRAPCRRPVRALAAMIGLLATCASAAADAPVHYPSFEWRDAQAVLVVATVAPGAELPEFEECKKPDVWCMHSPLWFKARVTSVIFGPATPGDLVVMTTSHYGMAGYEGDSSPYLIVLARHGGDFVMPAYQRARLVADRSGDLYLPIYRVDPPWVLPCSAGALRESLPREHFRKDLGIPKDDFRRFEVLEHPELFQIKGGRAYPRYGIAIAKLQTHLAQTQPTMTQVRCPEEA